MPVLTQDASKAAVVNGQEVVHAALAEIVKWDEGPDGSLYVYGRASTPEVDTDDQIVAADWSGKALQQWLEEAPALRVQHNPSRDPAGSGVSVEVNRDGDGAHWVKAVVDEPVAQRLVKKRHLRAFSVGIAKPVIERDATGKARGGIIKGGRIVEVSLVDSPANRSCFLEIAKAAGDDGHAEFTGKVYGAGTLTKDAKPRAPKTVTVELPKGMSLSIKPSDLAKLATFKQRLATGGTVRAAPASAGTDTDGPELVAIKAVEAGAYKRDIDTATRRRLASEGRALPDLSYPVETREDAGNAVTLALSGHGDVAAAKRLIRRIARKEGWQDILDRLKGAGKKATAGKTAAPQVVKCDTCDGEGMSGGKPCPDCKKGKRMAKRAARKALTGPDVAKKKLKALCPECGAKQNREHKHCPECGHQLPAMAPQVHKNHDFVCLGCGKELDKGEKFCPECGKENPGHNPMADKKIPANKTAPAGARKDRVAKGRKDSGKPKGKTPAGASGAVSAPEAPAGAHREPDGAAVEAFEDDAGMQDGDHEAPAHLEALTGAGKAARPAAAKGKRGKKGKGKKGKPFSGQQAPPFGKDGDEDGGERSEKAAAFESSPDVLTSLRLKTLGVPLQLGVTHDLLCPAYSPGEVAVCHPQASLKSLDLGAWQARTMDDAASLPVTEAAKGLDLWNAALALKQADPSDLADLREGLHKAFRDANPGPGTFPTPTQIGPQQFHRPYLSDGHAAASPGHDGPNHAALPATGGIHPEQYRRGYLAAGHADDSPANTHPAGPMPAPDRTGAPTSGPARTYYRNTARESAAHAMSLMHDHIAAVFPDLCPMHASDNFASHPVPTPEGVPAVTPAPGTRGLGKSAKKNAKAQARQAERKAVQAGKRKAAKIRKKTRGRRRALEAKVLKGTITVDAARAKLGLDPVTQPPVTKATGTAEAIPGTVEHTLTGAPTPEDFAAAVAKATRPLLRQIGQQGKALKRQRKMLDAIAGQPDTAGAPFRGVALTKTSAPPAGDMPDVAKSAGQAQATLMAQLFDQWRHSPNPELREAAWAELTKRQLSVPPMT